ncbi:bifunctional D-glycero-beta-D-manno-heptose-7-phosphate kinase/D-glycero-beta-D-manno-heptose 1-phosphate adenylyltransferase HldE [Bradyrhizobium sp. NC92]|uniref:bifunctional D-glycero-beta-D-manno-heptose-7-phosphate kinase/D-glycero-beta-D-manno-heptose 1-phosphate adenylyltransferase HldE n=1 Tax=Bradyrhizobium sp. (strain NC92) TaxID=55395 RepID=UPI0021AAE448|nr:bifunctional D-glycero-beta-D-manno-heptose-7-phosphate kinase/D-glycero-beta-D-manno-heptose 1-phosphate adenylyltransferase HldE [Bradyrhizobium sp. NC92]UWU67619.1 bifunctional D-glycero-beta-D-manno-heptose-7-phosphate kinase/D-glycero-beta-D-manno-heptose 1-phosphate adenylyltransferase HldE [Bradyrhizobium sp. NC92]
MSTVDRFSTVKVLCIGDVMLDRFIGGDIKRISPERPVPVISIRKAEKIPGGAANVARNISSLSGSCTLVGLIGDDEAGRALVNELERDAGISVQFVASVDRPTTEKVRYVSQGQHVIRADIECAENLSPDLERELLELISRILPSHDVVVLSDYAKGVLTDAVIRRTIQLAQEAKVSVLVDPKSQHLERYSGATVITPNSKELLAATGIDPGTDNDSAVQACHSVLNNTTIESILVTRAERGMTLLSRKRDAVHIAATAREVADVVGAGDTAIATLSLAVGAGADLEEAAALANCAAGVVVGKHGTATVTRSELLDAFASAQKFSDDETSQRLFPLDDVKSRIALWKKDGLRVGFTNGCFDILHVGHLKLLNFARSNCDRLVVAVNSDDSVRRLKGPTRPINDEADRSVLLASLKMVDAVVIFDEDTPLQIIESICPDVLVKGADYQIDQIVGASFVLAHGGAVLRSEFVPGRSTSNVIAQISNTSSR